METVKSKKEVWEKEAEKVCHDFDVFCEYMLEKKAKLSKTSGNIGKKDCFELNSQLTVKEDFGRPTRFQKNYPVINFFYYVAVSHGILEPDQTGCYMQPGYNYRSYGEAEILEKYLLLLMTLLFDGRFSENRSWIEMNAEYLMEWAEETGPCINKVYLPPEKVASGPFMPYRDNLMTYLEELGVLTTHMEADPEDAMLVRLREIEIRPLFELAWDLYRTVCEDFDDEKEDLALFCFGTYWETHISGGTASGLIKIFEEQGADYGNQMVDLEINVRHGTCIRIVRMNLSDSLYRLHLMIQKVFEFDNDHLFAFYTGHGMMKETFTIPESGMSGDEYSVHDTALGDLHLHKGDRFSYLFDFGDEWWFDIRVVAVTEGSVPEPELIKAVHDAPVQYPVYEEDEFDGYEDDAEEWPVRVDGELKAGAVLDTIADDYIADEYRALIGRNKAHEELSGEEMRREIERMVLEEPERLLLFMTPQMRETLSGLLKESQADSSGRCLMARLYSFGFCMMPDENECEVLVPGEIKKVYKDLLNKKVKADALAETAERILAQCGVMEMDMLYAASGKGEGRISYEEFEFVIYSRLHYFGPYECSHYDGREIVSCYDKEVTGKILKERDKPGNRTCAYPDFAHMNQKELETMPESVREWRDYVRFNLNIDWDMANCLAEQIPRMAASGVIEKDKIEEWYRETLRKTGSRATKKGGRLIGNLCETMPLATRRGNRMEEKKQEYQQLSLFDS